MLYFIFSFHVRKVYEESRSVELQCVAISAGLSISAVYTVLLFIMKLKFKFKRVVKIIWVKEYILSAIATGCYVHYIEIKNSPYAWSRGVIPVLLMTCEFGFFTYFVNSEQKEPENLHFDLEANIRIPSSAADDKNLNS
ncbi:hypothetical protein Avbf_11183 [Armadillidium vulgare]|nr:hypothetical protein Avbf_11183 [Armadillidium vulgare]